MAILSNLFLPSSTGGFDYIKKTSNYQAKVRDAIIADTTAGTFSITLPGTPTSGHYIRIADGKDWSINPLTVSRNGSTIEGVADDISLDIGGAIVDFVFDGSTWQLYVQAGPVSGQGVTASGAVELSNKTINFATNTLVGVASTGTAQTLSNKTIEAATFTNGYTEETSVANSGSAYTIDLANGSLHFITLTNNCTYTFPAPVLGKSFTLFQKQDIAGGKTVSWPASVVWPGNIPPTITSTASKYDKFVFTSNGTNWFGSVVGLNY